MADFVTLRPRLIALRRDVLVQLSEADELGGGMLALLAGINAALLAVDAEVAAPLDDAAPAERAVAEKPLIPLIQTANLKH